MAKFSLIVGWLVNSELQVTWKEVVFAYLRFYTSTYLHSKIWSQDLQILKHDC
jgi:hypothetical protein